MSFSGRSLPLPSSLTNYGLSAVTTGITHHNSIKIARILANTFMALLPRTVLRWFICIKTILTTTLCDRHNYYFHSTDEAQSHLCRILQLETGRFTSRQFVSNICDSIFCLALKNVGLMRADHMLHSYYCMSSTWQSACHTLYSRKVP